MTGSWKKQREFFDSPQSRLAVQRHGHEVVLDRHGVSIDGQRILRDDLQHATEPPEFEVRPDGTVMYRDKEVATISPPEDWKTGEVTVYGEDGPTPQQQKEAEEDARRRRDERYRTNEQQQERTREGQEKSL